MPIPALPARSHLPTLTDSSELLLGMALPARCGRVTARQTLRALAWGPGHRLDIQPYRGMLIITSAENGRHQVGSRGELPLPANVRQMCRFEPGQPVFLVAHVTHDALIVHPVSAVAHLLANLHAELAGGDRDR